MRKRGDWSLSGLTALSYFESCTQRPRRKLSDTTLPLPSVNWRNIHGLPPTPPRAGCLANVIVWPGGMRTTLTVVDWVFSWTRFTELAKMRSALIADSARCHERVMWELVLLRSTSETGAMAVDGMLKSALEVMSTCT